MSTKERKLAQSLALDVSAASGQTAWLDMTDDTLDGAVCCFELATLTGGTSPDVLPTWEMSPDKTLVLDVVTPGAAMTQTGSRLHQTNNPCFRWMRVSWVTTGTPSAATANIWIEA